MFIYSVFDRVAERFGPPFWETNNNAACRQMLQFAKSMAHPGDYGLWCIAEFDEKTGDLDPLSIEIDWAYADLSKQEA